MFYCKAITLELFPDVVVDFEARMHAQTGKLEEHKT
jgi:hypothetical protein